MKVALVGLGPIGVEVGKALAARGWLASAADLRVDTAEFIDTVHAAAAQAYAGAEVAVLCTGSRLPQIAEQIFEAVEAGLHVVSTCEELAFPRLRHPRLAAEIDERARRRGVAVVGTGVNPGLVMDRLPAAIAAACVTVERVRVERVVDAARRRGPLRAKVGAGLSVSEFEQGVAAGRLGHVGLLESAALLADALGWPWDAAAESIEPVVAGGVVQGVKQSARIAERVRLDLTMAVGAPDAHDRIVVDGDPPLDLRFAGGIHGDRATVGTVVHAVARIGGAGAGLKTVISLGI